MGSGTACFLLSALKFGRCYTSDTQPAASLWGGMENCFNREAVNERGKAGGCPLLLSESLGLPQRIIFDLAFVVWRGDRQRRIQYFLPAAAHRRTTGAVAIEAILERDGKSPCQADPALSQLSVSPLFGLWKHLEQVSLVSCLHLHSHFHPSP